MYLHPSIGKDVTIHLTYHKVSKGREQRLWLCGFGMLEQRLKDI